MKQLTYKLDIGTLKLSKRGKKGIFSLDISFADLGDKNRYRASVGTNKQDLAEPKAIAMVQSEYKRRKSGIHLDRKTTPQNYLEHTHIAWLKSQIGKPIDNKPNNVFSEQKYKNDTNVIKKWFIPYLQGKSWEQIETSKFGRDLIDHLRNHIKDATISSYIGILNRMMRQAEIENHVTSNQIKGIPALAQSHGDDEQSYASATDEMIQDLFEHMRNKIRGTNRKDLSRTYIQAYALARIWADTGIRPFTVCPLNFNDFDETRDTMVIIDRKEKNKKYKAQGSSMTRQALDDLRQLYLSEGTNVNQHSHLPIIHHAPCGNNFNGTDVEPYSQITRAHLNVGNCIKEVGWHNLKDKDGKRYRNYSIRKWHINKSIDEREDRFQIADRVGHTYAVLEKFYLNKRRQQETKADIWKVNTNTQPTISESNTLTR